MTTDGDFYSFEGDHYREGFLYKWFPVDAIVRIIITQVFLKVLLILCYFHCRRLRMLSPN